MNNARERMGFIALFALCAAALALVLALTFANRRVSAKVDELSDKLDLPYVGMYVPIAVAQGANDTIALGKPAVAQVLFFYNTTCPFCRASLPSIKRLTAALASASPRTPLIGVSRHALPETQAYVERERLGLPAYSLLDERSIALFHAASVPTLMVVSSEGKITYVRNGSIGDTDVAKAEAAVRALDALGSGTKGGVP